MRTQLQPDLAVGTMRATKWLDLQAERPWCDVPDFPDAFMQISRGQWGAGVTHRVTNISQPRSCTS